MKRYGLHIGGAYVDAEGGATFETVDPYGMEFVPIATETSTFNLLMIR